MIWVLGWIAGAGVWKMQATEDSIEDELLRRAAAMDAMMAAQML